MLTFNLTIEEWWEARIKKLFLDDISKLENFFGKKYFGDDISILSILIYCDPYEPINQRIKYKKDEKRLSLDVIIDYNELSKLKESGRKKYIIKRITEEVKKIEEKYSKKIIDFDFDQFIYEFNLFFDQT